VPLNGETVYTFTTQLADRLRHNARQVVTMQVYNSGSLVEPDACTFSLLSPNGTSVITDQTAPFTSGSGNQYTIAAGVLDKSLDNIDLGEGWQEVWKITLDGNVREIDREVILALRPLEPTVSDADIEGELPSYFDWVSDTTAQAQITAAFREIVRRWSREGGATYLAKSRWAFHDALLYLSIAKGLRNLGAERDSAEMTELANHYQGKYEAAWPEITTTMDNDHDGRPDDPSRRTRPPSVIQRNAPRSPRSMRSLPRGY
jgi:hypothetical protein